MYEINLVPDVKAKAIQAQRKRNLVFFVCAVVSAIGVGIVVLLGSIRGGQELTISMQDDMLKLMSSKLDEYGALNELLTVQKQLSGISDIEANKTVASRMFTILASILPSGQDTVTISKASIDMETAVISFEGQANAGPGTDGIDYRVLESFTKQVGLMKYDYGRYVDEKGELIPTMCISETNTLGVPYTETDEDGLELMYAVWAKGVKGCDPSKEDEEVIDEEEVEEAVSDEENKAEGEEEGDEKNEEENKTIETVKIYRTPKFNEWYKNGYLSEDGAIEGVAHFESQCVEYSGVEATTSSSENVIKWVSTNDCNMTSDGIEITESSNGRMDGGDLVLRFTGSLYLDPDVLDYNKKHMVTVAPSGRVNVTDSLLQVENMFSERAADCEPGDVSCSSGR